MLRALLIGVALTTGACVHATPPESRDAASIQGTPDDDSLVGTDGDDRLTGGPGNDMLSGGSGRDELDGGEGDDTIDSGLGRDIVRGGPGADTFVIDIRLLDEGYDLIVDFDPNEGDQVVVRGIDPSRLEHVRDGIEIRGGVVHLFDDFGKTGSVVEFGRDISVKITIRENAIVLSRDF